MVGTIRIDIIDMRIMTHSGVGILGTDGILGILGIAGMPGIIAMDGTMVALQMHMVTQDTTLMVMVATTILTPMELTMVREVVEAQVHQQMV